MKTTIKIILAFFALTIIFLVGSGIFITQSVKPLHEGPGEEIYYEIRENVYGKGVLNELEEMGIVRDADIAYYYSKLILGSNMNFKAGVYKINNSWTLAQINSYLSDASNSIQDVVRIKFIEGLWLEDYTERIADKTNLTREELMEYWNDKTVLQELMTEYEFLTNDIFNSDIRYPLEGYLFPDTYEFFSYTTCEQVTHKLLDRTEQIYNKYKDAFKASSFSIHEIFTLASIVQFEGLNFEEMTKISSVFLNRINKGMMLQSCATRCYAANTKDMWEGYNVALESYSPYDTYANYGLTPGPICAPGESAIYASLYPEDTDYLFFVADWCGDGTTHFSATYAEHLENIEAYLSCYY